MKNQLLLIFAFLISLCSFAQGIAMQNGTISQCNTVFTDSGGTNANYGDNENFILTLCPEVSGDLVELDFSVFSTQLQADIMTIYNGDSVNSQIIGNYSGGGTQNNPGIIVGDNTSGCLTIQFNSNSTGNTIGWIAQVNCINSAAFQISPTCDGAVVSNVLNPGGTFAFNPAPTDGAVIDTTTGTVSNATPDSTYTVEYTTSGAQPVSSTVSFIVLSIPTANTPADLEVCDDDVDGIAAFDLQQQDQQILGGQDPADFYVTYYESQADAAALMNALSSPYTNTTNPQTIFAVVNSVSGNCTSNMVTFNLLVNTININPQSNDLLSCGYGQGIGFFDLTIYQGQLTNGNSNLIVRYFESLSDANNNTNVIVGPTFHENFNSPYFQIIYIRVEDPNTGCVYVSDSTVLYLNVFDVQVQQPTPLVEDDPDNDGFASFDLTSKDNEITAGNPNYSVTYHESTSDAENFTNPLVSPYNNIVANSQTVYPRVEDTVDGCYVVLTLELLTEFVPFQVNPATLSTCNQTANGTAFFDLTAANQDILSGLNANDFSIAYYEIYDDALTQINPITDAFTYNANPNTVIYAGVTETATGEYVITTIDLLINDLPIVDFDGNLTVCNGTAIVLNPNTNEPNFIYQWSTGDTTPEIVVTTGGTYTVTVTNPVTGCTNTGSTVVTSATFPVIGTANNLVSCNPNEVFDLTATIPEILVGLNPNDYIVTFYENANDASNGINAIQNPTSYLPPSGNQTITASVNAISNDCSSLSFFDVIIESCPVTVSCGQPLTTSFCYVNDETQQYNYVSIDGSPLQIVINSGQVENNFDALIVLDSDGVTNLNVATPYGNGGDISNLVFQSSGDNITIYVDSDSIISCQTNNYNSIAYTVDCLDTTTVPNCNAVLFAPQDLEIDVNENIDFSWSAATGFVTGYKLSLGTTSGGNDVLNMLDVGNVTTYDVGTLNYDTDYFVTITPYNTNGDATGCVETTFTTRADPNVIIDCSLQQPVNTTFCYTNNETQQYNFASNDGSPLYIVFNSGMTENNFDELIVLDSDGVTNLNADNPYGLNDDGDLTGLTFNTTGSTVTVYIQSDGSVISCTNDPIDFDVFCGSNIGLIQVNAFLDENNDGIFNGNDVPFNNGFFSYEVNDDGNINTVTSNTGSFTITNQDEANSYDITFAANSGYENCFTIPTALFENIMVTNGNTTVVNFPITELMPCEDLAVYLIPWSAPRPGFNYYNDLVIENLGSTTIASGTVTFVMDPIVDYVTETIIGTGVTVTPTATGATVDFTNLQPGETKTVWFQLYTPPTVNLGEFVTSSATYSTAANDVVSENNTSVITQEVIGSYDPNDITESHGRDIIYQDFITTDEYLYYTIRFQNVGTAEAINVRIENTLDPLLDSSTMQMLRSSHDVVMMQNANQLTWTFDNINLPAQQDDDLGSNGYVYYKIKPTAGYTIGTLIPNTAEIYFDFNAPVITNTFITEFVEPQLSVDEFNINSFSLYPNPAKEIFNIKLNNTLRGNTSVEIIDIQGKRILSDVISDSLQEKQLSVSNLEAGLYFVKLKNGNTQLIKKLIIE